jgi:hypothetical protein
MLNHGICLVMESQRPCEKVNQEMAWYYFLWSTLSHLTNVFLQYLLVLKLKLVENKQSHKIKRKIQRQLFRYLNVQLGVVVAALLMGVYISTFIGPGIPVALIIFLASISVVCMVIFPMMMRTYFYVPFRALEKAIKYNNDNFVGPNLKKHAELMAYHKKHAVLQFVITISIIGCYVYIMIAVAQHWAFGLQIFAANSIWTNILLIMMTVNMQYFEESSKILHKGLAKFTSVAIGAERKANSGSGSGSLSSSFLDADTLPSLGGCSTLVVKVIGSGMGNGECQPDALYCEMSLLQSGKLMFVDPSHPSGTVNLEPGTHAVVRVQRETFLRVSYETHVFGATTGHIHLFQRGETVIFAGDVEVDQNGYLLRWSNFAEAYKIDSAIGQAGLPYEKLWIWCREDDELYVTCVASRRSLAEQGSLLCVPSAGQLLSINAAAKFDVCPELYQACKDMALQERTRDFSNSEFQALEVWRKSESQPVMTSNDIKNIIKRGREERKNFLASKGFARRFDCTERFDW